jgi:hypothetical protein
MNPSAYIQYIVLEQLDALAEDGTSRVVSAFGRIAEEADEYASRMFESYAGIGEPGDFAEEATNQGAQYYSTLAALRQAMLNLLAVGIRHLHEQHRDKVEAILKERGGTLPDLTTLPGWDRVDELRLVANAVKHADGGSATQLRAIRPDLFVNPVLRGSPLAEHALAHKIETPLGGSDLYVGERDIAEYRDALRELWEAIRSIV